MAKNSAKKTVSKKKAPAKKAGKKTAAKKAAPKKASVKKASSAKTAKKPAKKAVKKPAPKKCAKTPDCGRFFSACNKTLHSQAIVSPYDHCTFHSTACEYGRVCPCVSLRGIRVR